MRKHFKRLKTMVAVLIALLVVVGRAVWVEHRDAEGVAAERESHDAARKGEGRGVLA